jgi:hypothetical protein
MFFCRQFPGSYMNEYLLNQEHLSLIRFMHHVFIRQFFEAEHMQKNKWCIFTRTSGELLRLHTGKGVLQHRVERRQGRGSGGTCYF